MLLSGARELPADDHRWAYEVKYDGWRVLAYVDRGELRLDSRNGFDLTARAVELAALGATLRRHRVILDGEIVALDAKGRPDFAALQSRMNGTEGPRLTLMIFDLLHLDGASLVALPYEERRRRLIGLEIKGAAWQTVSNSIGGGGALLAASRAHGLEGLVAKRLGSRYQPGKRSADWLKIKNWDESTLVIGGYVTDRDGAPEAILVGEHVAGELRYRGRVELGLARELLDVLSTIERQRSPFAGYTTRRATWVEPRLTAEVRHLVGDGLRHAVLRSVRAV